MLLLTYLLMYCRCCCVVAVTGNGTQCADGSCNSGLDGRIIAAIVVGCIVGVVLLIIIIFVIVLLCKKKQQKKQQAGQSIR